MVRLEWELGGLSKNLPVFGATVDCINKGCLYAAENEESSLDNVVESSRENAFRFMVRLMKLFEKFMGHRS